MSVVVPDGIEPIIGWRGWRLGVGRLWSTGVHPPALYEPGVALRAVCRRSAGHAAPAEGCRCGIYAVAEPGLIPAALGMVAIGTVKLWGKVVPGEYGWRAEYAYPDHLYVLRGHHQELRDYGVPTDVLGVGEWPLRESHILVLARLRETLVKECADMSRAMEAMARASAVDMARMTEAMKRASSRALEEIRRASSGGPR